MGFRSRSSGPDTSLLFIAGLFLAAVLVGLALPRSTWDRLPDFCPFLRLTGRPCPTCGLTRSWSALLHGDLAASFRFHAWGPLLLAGIPVWLGLGWHQGRLPRIPRIALWALGSAWVLYAVARMFGWPGAGRP